MENSIYIILNPKLKEMEDWRTANTIFMLGIVLGNKLNGNYFGSAVIDGSGIKHAGIGNTVLPILSSREGEINSLYQSCKEKEINGNFEVIDFTLTAQNSHIYDEYSEKLSKEKVEDQIILGIALYGETKSLKSICGSLGKWK